MRSPRAVLVIFSVLVVVATLTPVGSSAPPPEGVCGICGTAFERTAETNGIDAIVGESSLFVRVTADGDSRWTATVTLNGAAVDRFAENQTLLDRTVSQTYASHRTVVDDPENLTVTLEDRTITATFTVADATRQYPGGVSLFDGFVSYPPDGEAYVDADTLTVSGPPSTAITHAPPGSTVRGNRAVWTPGDDRRAYGPGLGREATIAFAPDDGLVSRATTGVAIRMHALGMTESELRDYATIPAVLLCLVAVGLLLAGDRLPPSLTRGRQVTRWIAGGVVAYVVLTALVGLVAGDAFWFVFGVVGIGLVLQSLLTAAATLLADFVDVETETNVPRIALVAVLAWTLALLLGAPLSSLLVLVSGPLVFYPFGVLAGAGHPARALFPAVAALGPFVAALPFVPRVGVVFVSPTMLAVLFVGTALLGVPLFAIGRRVGKDLAVSSRSTDGSGSPVSYRE